MIVATWNLHGLHDDVGALTRAVADLGADVLCIQEPPRGWGARRRLRELLAPAGLTVLVQGGGARSTALAARPHLPVTGQRAVRLPWTGRTRRGAAVADVAGVRFISVHLGLSARDRARHVPHLLALTDVAGPVVVGGDFNQPPTGAARRALARELTDLTAGVGPTFPAAAPAHAIDAVLGRNVRVITARTIRTPDVVAATDHLPLTVHLAPARSSDTPQVVRRNGRPRGNQTTSAEGLEGLEGLRGDLGGSGFTVGGVEELLGAVASAALHREQPLPALLATEAAPGPAATLVRFFLLGATVPRRALDAALPTLTAAGAIDLGLAEAQGSGPDDVVRARVDLRPYEDWWLASDLGEVATGGRLREDHVLGVGGASTTLANATVRTPRERTLDLGTGCGVQALHAATHSRAVVATDVSPRALAFTRFNAALNGLDVETRLGSMLEPVAGEAFDLVVSNPPFVITPRTGGVPRYEYRDGGRAGDDLMRDLVADLPSVLAPGGVAQLLGNWEHRRGEDWRERVGAWLDAAGLDGWVVQREVLDPAEYAETWLRDGGTTADREPAAWAAGYEAWLADFAARDVEAVGFGLLVLRRPVGGVTLRRLEERTGPVRQPLGEHLAAALAAHDRLATLTDDALRVQHLTTAPDVTIEQHRRPGEADPAVVLLRQGAGFGRAVQAGTALAGLVGACDGELTVGQIVVAIAALLDVPSGELTAELLPQVRDLVRDGFLDLPG